MRRFVMLLTAVGVVTAAALFSLAKPEKAGDAPAGVAPPIAAASGEKNPWTGLTPNAAPEQFQFAIVSDRAGGHRPGVFSKAVRQINLLQPEFVMSVGDLIEGSTSAETNRKDWDEFDGYVKQFQMPFFYCPGNHDAASKIKLEVYNERYGRPYYHFTFRNCLFVVLNSNDTTTTKDGKVSYGNKVGKEQIVWLEGVLKENAAARWTFVFLHHPIWATRDFTESGWLEVEKLLAGRKHNVYCGHLHTYRMYPRNGTNYYQLATTGGASSVRGVEYGEFDQCAWITMKPDGPVMANVILNGVLPHDLVPFESEEGGRKPAEGQTEVTGTVTFDGLAPPKGVQIVFTEVVAKPVPDPNNPGRNLSPATGNSRLAADGAFSIYGNRTLGLKPGRYAVTFSLAPTIVVGSESKNPVPEKYRTPSKTPLRVDVKKGETNKYTFDVVTK